MNVHTDRKSPVLVTPTKSIPSDSSTASGATAAASLHVILQQEGKILHRRASATAVVLGWAHLNSASSSVLMVVIGLMLAGLVCMLSLGAGHPQRGGTQDPLRPQGVASPPPSPFPTTGKSSGSRQPALLLPGTPTKVPPMCPQLILPHTEARFVISMNALHGMTKGSLDIMGTSGMKLLSAVVCDSPDGRRCLMLASPGREDDPRACVFSCSAGGASFEIFGNTGTFYGWLECPPGSKAQLLHGGSSSGEGTPVMQINMGRQSDLHIEAFNMAGELLAHASRRDDSWKLQATPGSDAVLVSSCMLALILLRPWPS